MRLIDADALFEVIKKSMAENPHKEKTQRAMHIHEHKYFLTLLTTFPTIQPEERTEERTETRACDSIGREDALLCLTGIINDMTIEDYIAMVSKRIRNLSPVQPEKAIPVSWIEAKITQLISMDNEFAGLTVHIIKTLLNEWKREQEGETE